jgi:DNA-binding PadR family transcriptional regulator
MAEKSFLDDDQFSVLEGMLNPRKDALEEGDLIELCLHVYAKQSGAVNIDKLITACRDEFKDLATKTQVVQVVNHMLSMELTEPGYIQSQMNMDQKEYKITDKGLAYLWDNLAKRNPPEVLDRYGSVIAKNKKLNAPDRKIETHDLFALMLLAVLRLEGQDATASDVCKVLVKWVKPTGMNAEPLPSELKYTNPQTRFARKVHNVFSSHNQVENEGLIERVGEKEVGTWRVTEAGKALLMKRTLKERRNLTMMMQAATIQKDMIGHITALNMVFSYQDLVSSEEEKMALATFSGMIQRMVKQEVEHVNNIKSVLETPETAKAEYLPKKKGIK